jgi:hypothetical protein
MTLDNPVTTWRPESMALIEEETRLAQAQPGFSPQELVKISYAQSLVERKFTLESLRRRRGMGGYVITGLRDTPISTSGIWDDLCRPKWRAAEFLPINSDAVLSLDISRKRRWHHGGDRPDRVDGFNHLSGTTVRWNVILFFTGTGNFKGSQLDWSLVNPEGTAIHCGYEEITHPVAPGLPQELCTISCELPIVEKGAEFRLEISLHSQDSTVINHWPLWVYPPIPTPPVNLAIYDPMHIIDEDWDWLARIPRINIAEDFPAKILLTTVLDQKIWRFVGDGGNLILLQQGDGPLPSRRCPFWRESIILFPEHPFWDSFPHQGHADMQFFGIATDIAFDSQRLSNSLPGLQELHPILRRLDAREFHMSEYLFEARIGKGNMIGCSLRIQGGMVAQPNGIKRNIAGNALLSRILVYLDNR